MRGSHIQSGVINEDVKQKDECELKRRAFVGVDVNLRTWHVAHGRQFDGLSTGYQWHASRDSFICWVVPLIDL